MNQKFDRLAVRDLTPWDAEWLFKITGDPDATRYMGFRTHKTVAEAAEMLEVYAASPTTFLAVVDKEAPGELLGVFAYEVSGTQCTIGLKFNLNDRRARGGGRLVAKPFVDGLLSSPKIWRVWSHCHVDNVAGHRATERCGAVLEGIMRRYSIFPNVDPEIPQDCRLYAITKT